MEQNALERGGSVNIEPAICNVHCERRWREERGLDACVWEGGGVGKAKHLQRGGAERFALTCWPLIV